MSKEGFLYILQSVKNYSYYIGSTKDLQRRIQYHDAGYCKATKHMRPLQLVFSQRYNNLINARRLEYKLKKFKSRNIIEKIINEGKIKMGA